MLCQELRAKKGCLQDCPFLPANCLLEMKYLKRHSSRHLLYTSLITQANNPLGEAFFANKETTEITGAGGNSLSWRIKSTLGSTGLFSGHQGKRQSSRSP